jgi:hypothetical protein
MCELPKHREATLFRYATYPAQKAGRSPKGGETWRNTSVGKSLHPPLDIFNTPASHSRGTRTPLGRSLALPELEGIQVLHTRGSAGAPHFRLTFSQPGEVGPETSVGRRRNVRNSRGPGRDRRAAA